MKIGIYAPAKNERKHVDEWFKSCSGADVISVADTGSTDGTKRRLLELGATVTDVRIIPWRFDDAFNIAMNLLPADIDVCIRLDLDERLQPGWRNALEKAWTPTTTRLRYQYVWNFNQDGTPGRQWWGDRIHARSGYRWMGATHEGLYARAPESQTFCEDVKIFHYPDVKEKKGDLALLIESCKDWPHDSRLMAYLGREYMYRNDFENATKTYKKFLTMDSNNVERGQAMINLATTDDENKEFWLRMASNEIPTHREPLTNLAQMYYNSGEWSKCYETALKALAITQHPMDYTCTPEAWGALPHDLASIASWKMSLHAESLKHARLALKHCAESDPSYIRLLNNVKFIEDFMAKNGVKT